MTEKTPPTDHPERRASDATTGYFAHDKGTPAHAAFAEVQIESIDLVAVQAPGHEHDDHFDQPAAAAPDKEQSKARQQFTKFKGGIGDFETTRLTRVDISDVRRGDVVAIKTIVGTLYFRIIDRIRGVAEGSGEILCECRYDLPNQWSLVHTASIVLPICTKNHVITNPDGSQRKASRALKMAADTELPDQVRNLLRESFFVDITVHATPQRERLRPVDVVRWMRRMAFTLKATKTKP